MSYAGDPALQAAERELERKLTAIELADLEELLRQEWGRRFYYRVVFLLCGIESEVFDPGIKDGTCAALHMAYRAGTQWPGRTLLQEAQRHFPEFWNAMIQERVAAAAEEEKRREQARNAVRTEGDDT